MGLRDALLTHEESSVSMLLDNLRRQYSYVALLVVNHRQLPYRPSHSHVVLGCILGLGRGVSSRKALPVRQSGYASIMKVHRSVSDLWATIMQVQQLRERACSIRRSGMPARNEYIL